LKVEILNSFCNFYIHHLPLLNQTILHDTNCMIPWLCPSISPDSCLKVSCLQEIWQRVDPKEEEEKRRRKIMLNFRYRLRKSQWIIDSNLSS